jgi:3-deoxy-D-manno-octulosonate 8-phosphate phosphatase (KDO 8-P phosphatase)
MDFKNTEKAKRIKLIGCDVDGVLTDGRIFLGERGEVFKIFYAQDGLVLKHAGRAGLKIAFITGRVSEIVKRRAKELNVDELHMGIENKLACMRKIWQRTHIEPEETAFIGDDFNDLALMKAVGLACTVPDGSQEVKDIADIVSKLPGGGGAVREIIEYIIKIQGHWQDVINLPAQ